MLVCAIPPGLTGNASSVSLRIDGVAAASGAVFVSNDDNEFINNHNHNNNNTSQPLSCRCAVTQFNTNTNERGERERQQLWYLLDNLRAGFPRLRCCEFVCVKSSFLSTQTTAFFGLGICGSRTMNKLRDNLVLFP